MKITKGDIVIGGILIVIIGFVFWWAFLLINTIEENQLIKKDLCKEYGFIYVDRDSSGYSVNDCYNIEDGVLQYYNVRTLNETDYLMRGIR